MFQLNFNKLVCNLQADRLRTGSKVAVNKGIAIAGGQCVIERLCFYFTFVLADSLALHVSMTKRKEHKIKNTNKKNFIAKNLILFSFLTLTTINSYGQEQDSLSTVQDVKKKKEIQQLEVPIYKLFPTENTWASLKLNTRNGKIWQVHYSISKDGYEGTLSINSHSLVLPEEEMNGRFNLYPTANMYNFILLDQVNGNTYKVQWHNDTDKRFIRRIK